jgi:dUTP pyrophosphatase
MEIKIKKLHEDAKLPIRATDGSAGYDLSAVSEKLKATLTGPLAEYDTGLSFEIPKGHVGLLFPRSSITTKTTLMLGNAVGVLDSDYRGSVKFQFRQVNPAAGRKYKIGDRIGQIVILPVPSLDFIEVDELSDTGRGDGGMGSTGE